MSRAVSVVKSAHEGRDNGCGGGGDLDLGTTQLWMFQPVHSGFVGLTFVYGLPARHRGVVVQDDYGTQP